MQIFPSAKCILSAIWVYFKSLSLTTHVKNLDLSRYVQEVWRSSPQKEISLMAESRIWQHWDRIMEVAYRILYSRALNMSDVTNENIYIWGMAVGWSDGSVRIRVSSSALFVVRPGNDNDRPNLEGDCTRSSGNLSVSREVSLTPLHPPLCLHIINLPAANGGQTHNPPFYCSSSHVQLSFQCCGSIPADSRAQFHSWKSNWPLRGCCQFNNWREGTKVIYSTSYEEQCYGSRLELKQSRSLGSVPRLAWRGGILISVILYFLLKFKYKPMAWDEWGLLKCYLTML